MPVTRASRQRILTTPASDSENSNQENKKPETKKKVATRSAARQCEEAFTRPPLQNKTNPKVKTAKDAATKKIKPKEKVAKVRKMRTLSREEADLACAAAEKVDAETPPAAVATIEVKKEKDPLPKEKEPGAQKRRTDEVNVETPKAPEEAEVSPPKKPKENLESHEVTEEQTQNINNKTEVDTKQSTTEKAASPDQCAAAVSANTDKEHKPSTSLSLRASTSHAALTSASTNTANAPAEPPSSRVTTPTLPEKLLSVLSNLYLNAAERLQLDFPPRCAEHLSYCHQQHYRAPLPEAPTHQQAQNLRCALQQQRYVSFVNLTRDICQRGEFPGDVIFTKLIELLLSLNAKTYNNTSLSHTYNKTIELFGLIVRTFPPCWLALRPFYISFFQRPLDPLKITPKNKPPLSKSTRIFEIILDLLEHTLVHCSADELQVQSYVDVASATEAKTTSPQGNNSEFFNQWEWEEREHNLQTFVALSPGCRLERLFVVLRLLLQILESDFVLWILHHHKTTKEWIFCEENRPLVVVVFELSKYTRLSSVVQRVFALFASAVSKNLSRARLQIIERYISLLMVASNTADMENTVIGVKYPYLGAQTKILIRQFFKIFKAHNTAAISTYIQTIHILRIPYVRYEFIDHFLQLFYFAHNDEMTPKKICYDMVKKRWLKYKPQAELAASSNDDEDLSREQYLKMLLDALRIYCQWHGSKTFLHLITRNEASVVGDNKPLKSIQTSTDSVHRWPTRGAGALVLDKMAADISKLEQQLKLTVRMSLPKVDLPIADICIDQEIITKYRNDLKFVMILHDMLPKHVVAHPEVDFTEWQAFLSDFAPNT